MPIKELGPKDWFEKKMRPERIDNIDDVVDIKYVEEFNIKDNFKSSYDNLKLYCNCENNLKVLKML